MSPRFLQYFGLTVSNRIASAALYGAVLFAVSFPAVSDPYGTLFTTASQRAQLDGQVDTTENAQPISGNRSEQSNTVIPLRLNGTLLGSKGKKEVWLDGRPQLSGMAASKGRIRLLRTDQVHVQATEGSIAHAMKPGQVLDPETGIVSEYYQQDEKL